MKLLTFLQILLIASSCFVVVTSDGDSLTELPSESSDSSPQPEVSSPRPEEDVSENLTEAPALESRPLSSTSASTLSTSSESSSSESSSSESTTEPSSEPANSDSSTHEAAENSEDGEEDDGGGAGSSCDSGLSSFVRNINGSAYLPDDYYEVSEKMWHEDLYAPVKDLNSTIEMIERLQVYGRKLQQNKDAKDAFTYLGSVFSDRLYEAKVSPQCMADILRVFNGIRNFEPWALRMPDAWANTVPAGLMSGHISTFGEYDQCVKIKSPPFAQPEGLPDRHVYGRYCTVQARVKVPPLSNYDPEWENVLKNNPLYPQLMEMMEKNFVPLQVEMVKVMLEAVPALKGNIAHYGICIPNTCSGEDVQNVFNAFFYPITKLPVVVDEDLCTDHKEIQVVKLDKFQWFAVYLLSILTSLVTLSTLYHLYLKLFVDNKRQLLPSFNGDVGVNNNNNDHPGDQTKEDLSKNLASNLTPPPKIERTLGQQFILAFSFIENSEKLFRKDHRLAIVDTLRFLLTVGVYAVQAFNFSAMLTMQMLRNLVDTLPGQLISDNRYFPARVPGMYIDGFVFTLGFTLYLSQSSRLRRANGQFSYFSYMFKRWFRLSVAMLGTFVFLYIFTLLGDGPIWFINERWILAPCKKFSSIASSFLYYSNWNPALNDYHASSSFPICNPPTWFLSCSTQIYAVLPLILVPLYRWPKFGMGLLLTLFAFSPFLTTSPTWFLGHSTYYDFTDVQTVAHSLRKFLNYHTNPLQYSQSACIGILTGWLLKNKPNFHFPGGRKTELALWILSFTGIVSCFVTNNYLWSIESVRPRWMTLSWIVSMKFVFPLACGYIIFMCASGRAKSMNKHLSVNSLQPLAKLSYSIYLLRVPIIFYRYTSVRYTYGLYYWTVWQNIAIDYTITAFFAFILYILFEAPSIKIIQIFENDQIWACLEGTGSRKEPAPEKEKVPNGNGSLPTIAEEISKLPPPPPIPADEPKIPQFFVYNGVESQRL